MAWPETTRAQYSRPHNDRQNDLTDPEWALIEPLIPRQGRMGRPRATDLRRVFEAIQYMLSSGCQWRLIPPCYPPFSMVQNHFYAWRNDGTLERMLDALRAQARVQAGRKEEPTAGDVKIYVSVGNGVLPVVHQQPQSGAPRCHSKL